MTATVPPTTETLPSTPTSISPSDGAVVEESGEPTESGTPPVLPVDIAGRPLVLGNIFKYPDGWKDGRYDVADRKQTTGISGVLASCGEAWGATLELRLANNFSKFKLEFGQSNSSESSDQILLVRIDANGQYRDQKSVKLNQITSFDLSVQKVNALKIIVSLKDTPACSNGTAEAVLMNMVLS